MKKNILIVLCIVLGVGAVSLRFMQRPSVEGEPRAPSYGAEVNSIKSGSANRITDRAQVQLRLGDKELLVEAVTQPQSLSQGLSGRDAIGSDGMLFVFGEPQTPTFWMVDMHFALDFIWIADDQIVEITENVPPPLPNQSRDTLPLYMPAVPVTMMLEVTAGSSEQWGLSVGDRVTIEDVLTDY